MKKLKVGIAGYGVVGKRRRQFVDLNPLFETTAVSDQVFGNKGVLDNNVRFFNDFHDLFAIDLDVLFVSLPNYIAAEACILGLEKGLHVFCEKPPGRDLQDIKNVMNIEKNNPQLKLKYGFNHRYHYSIREAKRIIESKELGTIVNLNGIYGKSHIIPYDKGWRAEREKAGGGILLDQGIHMIDLIRYFSGEYNEVKGFVSNSYWNHDVEDNVYAIMKNSYGQYAMVHSTATKWQHKFRLEITLTEGYLVLSGILSGSKSYGEEMLIISRKTERDLGNPREEIIRYIEDPSWKDEIDEFAECIVKDIPAKEGGSYDAFKTMQLVYKIYCSDIEWKNRYNLSDE